jgi:hypothetical protein
MDKAPTTQDKSAAVSARLLARRKREAEALRANLGKRKAQTRARKDRNRNESWPNRDALPLE